MVVKEIKCNSGCDVGWNINLEIKNKTIWKFTCRKCSSQIKITTGEKK